MSGFPFLRSNAYDYVGALVERENFATLGIESM